MRWDAFSDAAVTDCCRLCVMQVTPTHVVDCLKSVRTNILIWRQKDAGGL